MANLNASRNLNLGRVADRLVSDVERLNQLKAIANKKNYPLKIKQLNERIADEHDLWSRKNPTQKLLDLQKDLTFIQSQVDMDNLNKTRIDQLCEKYNIGYGKSGFTK